MRVIAGSAKGRVLHSPKGNATRPTTDRVKESLFAIVTPFLLEARVLDLFAGSGALAIEALSRGAKEAVLVENNRTAAQCIKRNIEETQFTSQVEIIVAPVLRALSILSAQSRLFDLVLLDPPYEQGHVERTLNALTKQNLLSSEGLVVVEHSRKEEIPSGLEKFAMRRQEMYGDTVVSFLRTVEPLA